jgi:ketosteroid isomerase-like protein
MEIVQRARNSRPGGGHQASAPTVSPNSGTRSAGQVAAAFAEALLAGDVASASAFFSPVARFLTPDGTELSGRQPIAELLAQLADSEQRLEISCGRTLVSGPVALSTQYWTRRSKSRMEHFEVSSRAQLVLTCEAGSWRIAIATPWIHHPRVPM